MIQEVFQCKFRLSELFPKDPTHCRYTGEVVILHRRQFPEGRVDRFRRERRGIVGVVRIYTISQIYLSSWTLGLTLPSALIVPLQHPHTAHMSLEQAIHEGQDKHYPAWRSGQGKAGQALDERCDECRGEESGSEEGIEETEETGTVARV